MNTTTQDCDLKLLYTPRSHFARKVRILTEALKLPLTLIDVGDVGAAEAALFGPNPLLAVPTLLHGEAMVVDSDHIAAWLVRRFDPEDRFKVLTTHTESLNARAVMNGLMAREVEILLAERSGLDTRGLPRFEKMRQSLRGGLQWLEARAADFSDTPDYSVFHLLCLWQHMHINRLIDARYPALEALVQRWVDWPPIANTAPR